MSILPPNDESLLKEALPKNEKALYDLAKWWGPNLIRGSKEINEQPFFPGLNLKSGLYQRHITLATHHTKTETSKKEILELGALLGIPNSEQILFYGEDAAKQILASLGFGGIPYGKPKDGLTFVYLHPVPPELNEECDVVKNGGYGPFEAFVDKSTHKSLSACRFEIERTLQTPWETIYVSIAEQRERLKQILKPKRGVFDFVDFDDPNFPYKLRMLDNKYLLGVI